MEAVTVERYQPTHRAQWDRFVARSKNGTFLFFRDYMEYHRDRFADHSLVVREGASVLALLPANLRGALLESHGGLTYGGFVVDERMTVRRMADVLTATLAHLRDLAVTRLIYRAVPHIYHVAPAEEDLYALGRAGARVAHRAVLAVLEPAAGIAPQARRRRALRTAEKAGLVARECDDLAEYWTLLTTRLHERYGARPVHSLDDILGLRARFPDNIRLFGAFQGSRLVGGVLVYESWTVARAQYIAASAEGTRTCALDLILDLLVRKAYPHKRYIDLGTSEAATGAGLNDGVLEFKESFGARAVAQDTYELAIA